METEIWKDAVGYEWLYKVSNLGRIWSCERLDSDWKKRWWIYLNDSNSNWYRSVNLYKNWKKYSKTIHRLLAEAFLINTDNKLEVNHKNWIKYDNRLDNLEWTTRSENQLHSLRILGHKNNFQTNHPHKWKFWKYNHSSKPVMAIDKEWNEFTFWWISEWARELNIKRHIISDSLRWRLKLSWLYTWKYL